MKTHPAAERFPMLSPSAFEELKSSISEQGQCLPCIVWEYDDDEILLDGRNRYKACNELGISPLYQRWYGDEKAALDYIVALNLHRRNLTKSQCAAIAAELVPMYAAACREAQREGGRKKLPPTLEEPRHSREAVGQAAKAMGVGRTSVAEAKALREEDPVAFEAVRRGEQTVSGARKRERRQLSTYERAVRAVFALSDEDWQQLKLERDSGL